jgi:pyridoxal phosphate enzyme (YggS family)
MFKNNNIIKNLEKTKREIKEACLLAKVPEKNINLVAVSKTIESPYICEAAKMGHRAFGENKVQEAIQKWPDIKKLYPKTILHMIGPLQSNKVKDAIKIFDVIETLDREKIALELKKNINKFKSFPKIYVQVNIGEEKQKSGCPPSEAKKFISNCNDYGLNIEGVMAIPPQDEDPAPYFALLSNIAKESNIKNISMGMSKDFEMAIYLGATSVRVGTKIFGERKDKKF